MRPAAKVIAGEVLAAFAGEHAAPPPDPLGIASSARNRFVGIVTRVNADGVMAEVQMQCGPFTVVSLMSSESAAALGLERQAGRGRRQGDHRDRRNPRWKFVNRIIGAVAAVGAAALVAGCSGSSPAPAPSSQSATTSAEASAATGEITVFAAASLKATFTELGTQFQEANPGTTVTFNFAGSSDLVTQLTQEHRPTCSPQPTRRT